MLAAAVAPVLTLPIDREFAGPAGPWGSTNESDCEGAMPVTLTAAVVPVVTLPIDSEFAGPTGPTGPTGPG
jgi:hypothetical protein